MPNWYDRAKTEQLPKSRYTAEITADIWVPQEQDKEQERVMARDVLDSMLPTEGTVPSFPDSNIRLNIVELRPHAKLV